MTPPGAALWARLGLQAVLPQPWQLLTVAALPLSLLAGSALAGRRWGPMLREPLTLAAVLAAVLLASYPYLSPRTIPAAVLPDLSRPPVARFQDGLLLAGYRVDQPAGARVLRVTLTWQALAPVAQDYTVFTHLVDAAGKQVGQKDARPLNGARPTNTWLPGEVVSDTLEIALAPEAGPGSYALDVGLYVLATGPAGGGGGAVAGSDAGVGSGGGAVRRERKHKGTKVQERGLPRPVYSDRDTRPRRHEDDRRGHLETRRNVR